MSLAVRLLWKENKHAEALALAHEGIQILTLHLDDNDATTATASSLFPLLARMYRLRSLAAESLVVQSSSISSATANGVVVAMDLAAMAQAHNLATLRRDVDTQATLLNAMLRDLLRNSQGTVPAVYNV
jgi:hypothetical protein